MTKPAGSHWLAKIKKLLRQKKNKKFTGGWIADIQRKLVMEHFKKKKKGGNQLTALTGKKRKAGGAGRNRKTSPKKRKSKRSKRK